MSQRSGSLPQNGGSSYSLRCKPKPTPEFIPPAVPPKKVGNQPKTAEDKLRVLGLGSVTPSSLGKRKQTAEPSPAPIPEKNLDEELTDALLTFGSSCVTHMPTVPRSSAEALVSFAVSDLPKLDPEEAIATCITPLFTMVEPSARAAHIQTRLLPIAPIFDINAPLKTAGVFDHLNTWLRAGKTEEERASVIDLIHELSRHPENRDNFQEQILLSQTICEFICSGTTLVGTECFKLLDLKESISNLGTFVKRLYDAQYWAAMSRHSARSPLGIARRLKKPATTL